jgi:hypothetical protein
VLCLTHLQVAQRSNKRKESKSKIRDLAVSCLRRLERSFADGFFQVQLQTVGNRLNEATIENEQAQVSARVRSRTLPRRFVLGRM